MTRLALPMGFTSREAYTLDFTNGSIAGSLNTFANMSGMSTSQTDRWRCNWTSALLDQHMGVKYEFPADQDFSSYHTVELVVGFPTTQGDYLLGNAINRIGVFFVKQTGTSFTDYYVTPSLVSGIIKQVGGKYVLSFPKSICTVGAGAPNWNQIRRIEIRITATAGGILIPGSFDIYSLRFLRKPPRTYVCLTFDDNGDTQYTEAYNAAGAMRDLGFRGGVALNANSFGVAGKMTNANLLTLQDAGWEVYNHTIDHLPLALPLTLTLAGSTVTAEAGLNHGLVPGDYVEIFTSEDFYEYAGPRLVLSTPTSTSFTFTALSTARSPINVRVVGHKLGNLDTMASAITRNSEAFVAKGLVESSVFVQPYGAWSPRMQALVQSLGYTAGRGVGNRKGNASLAAWYSNYATDSGAIDIGYDMSSLRLGNTETASGLLSTLDSNLPYGGIITFYGHNIVTPAVTGNDFAVAEWTALLAGLRLRQQQGLIDIVPLGEALSLAKAGRAA